MEFSRRNIIRRAQEAELYTIITNSDGSPPRRRELLALLGSDSAEEVLDPGIQTVTRRLSVDGRLSPNCEQAINRWFGRLNNG